MHAGTQHSRAAVVALTMLVVCACMSRAPAPSPRVLLVVVDGLRPDFIRPESMPHLQALADRGVVFTNHHSVFPTVTRVNAASIATGTYPETHGLLGNAMFVPALDPDAGVSTGSKATLDGMATAAGGRVLTATTLADALAASGRTLLALSSGTEGSGLLLNPTAAGAGVIHPDFTLPASLRDRLDEVLGDGPSEASTVETRTRWIVDAYLEVGLEAMAPDVTIMWMGTLDTVAHASGVGSPEMLEALAGVDAELGRLEAGLRERGLLERTNVIVTSDHGFSTHAGGFDPESIVAAALGTGENAPAFVIAEGAIHLTSEMADVTRQEIIEAIVGELQRDPSVGAVFTRATAPGSPEGIVAGTLSFDLARWNHARAGDILVSAAWDDATNAHGYRGRSTNSGVAGHGSTSPFDIHATLIASGPAFRQGVEIESPTANVDLAPTVLHLFELPAPPTMDGRVIIEAMHDGPSPDVLEVTSSTVSVGNDGYSVTARTTIVDNHVYVDDVAVRRASSAARP